MEDRPVGAGEPEARLDCLKHLFGQTHLDRGCAIGQLAKLRDPG